MHQTCVCVCVCVCHQRAELAALRSKREQENEMKRAQAKRDKLFVANHLLHTCRRHSSSFLPYCINLLFN